MGVVLDASAAVELLTRTPRGAAVDTLLSEDMAAPELFDVEVLSACARLVRSQALSAAAASAAVGALADLPLVRVPHGPLSDRAWQLRDRVRVADAFYVACAEALGMPLLTCDARLATAPLPGTSVLMVR